MSRRVSATVPVAYRPCKHLELQVGPEGLEISIGDPSDPDEVSWECMRPATPDEAMAYAAILQDAATRMREIAKRLQDTEVTR